MKILGITGGIGSGKSVVSRLLVLMGCPVYLSDDESKALLNTSFELRKELIKYFGSSVYNGCAINRKLFASIIFSDQEKLNLANSIIHPAVKKHFQQWVRKQKVNGKSFVGIESAILYESGFDQFIDKTIFVQAPINARVNRVIARDNVSRESVYARINNQLSDDEKRQKADFVIINDEKHSLIVQLQRVISLL